MSWLPWAESVIEPIKPILKKCKPKDNPGIVALSKLIDQVDLGKSKMATEVKNGPRSLSWKTRFLTAAGGDPELALQKIKEMLAKRKKNWAR